MLHDGRPDGSRQIVATGEDGDGNAAAPVEPQGRVGNEGREGGGTADADEDSLRQGEGPDGGGRGCDDISAGQGDGADEDGAHDALSIGQSSQHDPAQPEADHG